LRFITVRQDKEKQLNRLKKNFNNKKYFQRKQDSDSVKSLISMNDGREKMRSALGMTLETSTEEAINRFWTLGEFLELGTPKELGKLSKDMVKRKKLLQRYKSKVIKLKDKLEEEEKIKN